ncbi:hypothetical protein OSTOST_09052 [Ostertagia ostertagi]
MMDSKIKSSTIFWNRLRNKAEEHGVISSIFGRFWRPQNISEPETSSSTKFYLEDGSVTDEKEDGGVVDSLGGDNPANSEDSSSNIPNSSQMRGNGMDMKYRLSPSPSGNGGIIAAFVDKYSVRSAATFMCQDPL